MKQFAIKSIISALALATAGCGGGDSDAPVTTASSVTVSPSLGVITNATVSVFKSDGTTLLGSGDLGALGQVTISFADYSGPVAIEVAGDADAKYFDEASNMLVSFPAGKKLRAIAPSGSGTFGVTALTELAYQGAVSKSLFPISETNVNQLNEKVRLALAPEIASLLTAPTAFNASTTAGSLGNDDAGKYALKLAALAKLGEGQSAPALAVMEALAADLADGDIDGKNGADASVGAPYGNFDNELGSKLTALATSLGSQELKNALSGFPAIGTSIDFGAITAGTGSGQSGASSLACDTSLFQSGAPVTTPSGIDLIAFAGAYIGAEGTFDSAFTFTKTGNANLSMSVAGVVTYNGTEYATTSACVEALTGGGKQLVLHFANAHVDISDDRQSISGVSPAGSAKIIQANVTSTNGTLGFTPY